MIPTPINKIQVTETSYSRLQLNQEVINYEKEAIQAELLKKFGVYNGGWGRP